MHQIKDDGSATYRSWRKNLVKKDDNISMNISFNAGSSGGYGSVNKNSVQYKAVERDHLSAIIANLQLAIFCPVLLIL